MYTPKLRDDQVRKLYQLKQYWIFNGKKLTMASMVRKAVDDFIKDLEDKEKMGEELSKVGKQLSSVVEI